MPYHVDGHDETNRARWFFGAPGNIMLMKVRIVSLTLIDLIW